LLLIILVEESMVCAVEVENSRVRFELGKLESQNFLDGLTPVAPPAGRAAA
jgi:hypothetical protein